MYCVPKNHSFISMFTASTKLIATLNLCSYLSSFLHTLHVLFGLSGAIQCTIWVATVTIHHPILGFLTHWYPTMQRRVPRQQRMELFLQYVSRTWWIKYSRKLLSDFSDSLVKLSARDILELCILKHTEEQQSF